MIKLSVKNVKTMRGHDGMPGGAWECDLYIDGIKAAYVQDDSWGGPIRFEWIRKDLETPFKEYCQNLPRMTDNEAIEIAGPQGIAQTPETVVSGLVDEFEQNKQLKKWCVRGSLFRLKGDKKDSWRTVKTGGKASPYTPQIKDWIVKTYGDRLEEILNERFIV